MRRKKISRETLREEYPQAPWSFTPTHKVEVRSQGSVVHVDYALLVESPKEHGLRYAFVPDSPEAAYAVLPGGKWQPLMQHGTVKAVPIIIDDRPRDRKQGVYFIHAQGYDPVKIGWSTDIALRMKQLQTARDTPLELMGWIHTTDPALERYLHSKYREFHEGGEWYSLPEGFMEDLRSFGYAVQAGT